MSGWNDSLVGGVREVLGGDDEVDITIGEIFRNHRIFLIEGGIVKIQNRGVREIEPTDCIRIRFKLYATSVIETRVLLTT